MSVLQLFNLSILRKSAIGIMDKANLPIHQLRYTLMDKMGVSV